MSFRAARQASHPKRSSAVNGAKALKAPSSPSKPVEFLKTRSAQHFHDPTVRDVRGTVRVGFHADHETATVLTREVPKRGPILVPCSLVKTPNNQVAAFLCEQSSHRFRSVLLGHPLEPSVSGIFDNRCGSSRTSAISCHDVHTARHDDRDQRAPQEHASGSPVHELARAVHRCRPPTSERDARTDTKLRAADLQLRGSAGHVRQIHGPAREPEKAVDS
jgi:hypothetical protein